MSAARPIGGEADVLSPSLNGALGPNPISAGPGIRVCSDRKDTAIYAPTCSGRVMPMVAEAVDANSRFTFSLVAARFFRAYLCTPDLSKGTRDRRRRIRLLAQTRSHRSSRPLGRVVRYRSTIRAYGRLGASGRRRLVDRPALDPLLRHSP